MSLDVGVEPNFKFLYLFFILLFYVPAYGHNVKNENCYGNESFFIMFTPCDSQSMSVVVQPFSAILGSVAKNAMVLMKSPVSLVVTSAQVILIFMLL